MALMDDGYELTCIERGRDCLDVLGADIDVALINAQLPDMTGIEVLVEIRQRSPATACIVLTDPQQHSVVVEAARRGACNYLEKPLRADALLDAVKEVACEPSCQDVRSELEVHSLRRWAQVIVGVIDSPSDTRTLEEWGRTVGVSPGGLRNWCRTARMSAKRSLLFARVLRAIVRSRAQQVAAEDVLNIVDRRTLLKLFRASGGNDSLPQDLEAFFARQQFIEDGHAINEVRVLLRGSLRGRFAALTNGSA